MADDVEVTEFIEIEPSELHFVARGANGFPPLLAKAADSKDCPTCKGSGKIMDGNRKCPDCDGSGKAPAAEKAELDAKARNALDDSDFAYIDSDGGRHLPINDEAHVKAALGRFDQTQFDKPAEKSAAAKKILAAAKKFGIDVSADADVADAAKSVLEYAAQFGSVTVSKDGASVTGTPDMVTPDPLTAPDPGTMQTPGSAGWEAQDAANLIAAGQALAAAQKIVTAAQEREQIEVATGHADDMQDVWDLGDALYAIQCALGIVARVAFQEEAEADGATKAGKVLSGKSKGAITSAISALKDLLAAAGEDNGDDADTQKGIEDMTQDELIKLLDERDEARRTAKAAKKAAKAEKSANAEKAEAERRAALSPEELEAEDAAKAAEAEQSEAAKAEQVQATATAVAEKVEEALKGVTEQVDAMKAELETVKKMAAPGGPVKTRTPAAVVKSEQRDALEMELAELNRKIAGEVDVQVIKGYMDRAEAVRVKLDSLAA